MAGFNGTDYVLQVNTGTPGAPTWVTIGSQRDATVSDDTAEIDTSSKDSPDMEILPGRRSGTIDLEMLYVDGDTEMQLLKDAIRNSTLVQLQELVDGIAAGVASGYLTSRSESYPDQGEAVVSVTFRRTGAWA